MTASLVGDDIVDGDEDTGLLDEAELIVDRRTEYPHLGGECHVGADQRRDVQAMSSYSLVQGLIVGAEVFVAEELGDFLGVYLYG